MSEKENSESNDWGEVFRAIRKMHPFVIAFAVALSIFSGVIYRSDLCLGAKLTLIGACVLLQVLAVSFEAIRIDREEKLIEYALRKGVLT